MNTKNVRQILTFLVIGVINTAIDFGAYWFLTRIALFYYVIANIFSVAVATTAGFFLHKYVTFENKEKKLGGQYLKFWAVSLGTLIINSSLVFVLVHFLSLHDLLAKILATAVIIFWSYLMQRIWVFKGIKPEIVV